MEGVVKRGKPSGDKNVGKPHGYGGVTSRIEITGRHGVADFLECEVDPNKESRASNK